MITLFEFVETDSVKIIERLKYDKQVNGMSMDGFSNGNVDCFKKDSCNVFAGYCSAIGSCCFCRCPFGATFYSYQTGCIYGEETDWGAVFNGKRNFLVFVLFDPL